MAAVIVGERTLSQGVAPRKSSLVLDDSATPEQRRAAEAFLRENFGPLLGDIRAVHAVPIEFRRAAGGATLRIGDMVNLEMRQAKLPEDALQGAILWYGPFVPMTEQNLGTTMQHRYWGEDFNRRWSRSDPGVTGYYGTFVLQLR